MASVATGVASVSKREKFSPASTFISEVEYNPAESTMDITFHSGTKYRYLQVSPVTYLSFKQSPTFDSYYSRAIKGNIQSVKLIDQGIGREKSAPLARVKEQHPLDAGLRKRQNQRKRINGILNRIYSDAA